jgi:hypothetical protein
MVIASVGLVAVAPVTAGQPMQANAKVRGKTLAEWSFLQNEWIIATGLGGQTLPDTVGKMQFLPGPFGPGVHEFDVVTTPGTSLVSPPFFAFGELYEDGTFDDPNDPFLAGIIDIVFNETQLDVSLDGKQVLSGTPAELGGYAYGFDDPLFFDEPIFYAEPQDRGSINAVAALWTTGVGAIYHPLSPGEHTLKVIQDSPIFGFFDITFNITVQKPGASVVPEPATLIQLGSVMVGLIVAVRGRAQAVRRVTWRNGSRWIGAMPRWPIFAGSVPTTGRVMRCAARLLLLSCTCPDTNPY